MQLLGPLATKTGLDGFYSLGQNTHLVSDSIYLSCFNVCRQYGDSLLNGKHNTHANDYSCVCVIVLPH